MIDYNLMQIGGSVIVALSAFKCVEIVIDKLTRNNNNNNNKIDAKQDSVIAVLSKLQELQSNDLIHIKKDIEKLKITVTEIKEFSQFK